MSWVTDANGCGKCNHCGMDMDMEPFCVDTKTLDEAKLIHGHPFPYGLNINDARQICEGVQWEQRKPM